jgi:hypothetical protein
MPLKESSEKANGFHAASLRQNQNCLSTTLNRVIKSRDNFNEAQLAERDLLWKRTAHDKQGYPACASITPSGTGKDREWLIENKRTPEWHFYHAIRSIRNDTMKQNLLQSVFMPNSEKLREKKLERD